jgi:hypothetical protein
METPTLLSPAGSDDDENTPVNDQDSVDFDAHDSTVWRGSYPREHSADRLRGTPMTPTPRRQVLTGLAVATPHSRRSDVAASMPHAASPRRHLEVDVFATPLPRVPSRHARVVLTLVDLPRRSYRWRIFDVAVGESVRELANKARVLWGKAELVLFRRHRGGTVSVIGMDRVVSGRHTWWCCECRSGTGDSGELLAHQPAYHVVADSAGRLCMALPPAVAQTVRDAKCAPGLTAAHVRYLEGLDVLGVSSGGRRALSLVPLPQLRSVLVTGVAQAALVCAVAVVHPALRPGDVALWHRRNDGVLHCHISRTYVVNGLAAVELRELVTDVAHVDVSPVDIERLS